MTFTKLTHAAANQAARELALFDDADDGVPLLRTVKRAEAALTPVARACAPALAARGYTLADKPLGVGRQGAVFDAGVDRYGTERVAKFTISEAEALIAAALKGQRRVPRALPLVHDVFVSQCAGSAAPAFAPTPGGLPLFVVVRERIASPYPGTDEFGLWASRDEELTLLSLAGRLIDNASQDWANMPPARAAISVRRDTDTWVEDEAVRGTSPLVLAVCAQLEELARWCATTQTWLGDTEGNIGYRADMSLCVYDLGFVTTTAARVDELRRRLARSPLAGGTFR